MVQRSIDEMVIIGISREAGFGVKGKLPYIVAQVCGEGAEQGQKQKQGSESAHGAFLLAVSLVL
jgi:hypothetical protein